MPTNHQCDYCDSDELAYELKSGRGPVCRCIPCLAVERGSRQLTMPFEEFINNQKHEDSPVFDNKAHWREHREMSYESARDWYVILGRIRQDKPILKRDPDSIGTVNEHIREFLTNIMGAAAHYSPSEIIESDGDPSETTLS